MSSQVSHGPDATPTAAERLLTLCVVLGIDCVFANFGSDHPAFMEGLAKLRQRGVAAPRVIVCPHEMTALSAAHGYAMITRRPQLVLVHVDVGTQNLGGSVHNVSRGRVPVIIVAGLSPIGERPDVVGSRTEYIHYIQDTSRQHEIVGAYMKWSYELRSAETVQPIFTRAWQIASSSPQGPTYLTGAREVWDETDASSGMEPGLHPPVQCSGLTEQNLQTLRQAIDASRRAVLVTSYLGRNPDSVGKLVSICDGYAIGVLEVGPQYMNFPGDHVCHLGYRRDSVVDQADLILLVDVDVPWLPRNTAPAAGTQIFQIDMDPLKPALGAWHFGAHHRYAADSGAVFDQLLAHGLEVEPEGRRQRMSWIQGVSARRMPAVPGQGPIVPAEVALAVRELVNDRTVVLCESPSSALAITSILRMNRPGSFFASGGSGLGWCINAAIGAKLASPGAEVIALVGDGCYLFGVPSSTYWVAGAYGVAVLTVILNNGGWQSPKTSTHLVHPNGAAHAQDTYWVSAGAGARLADLAAAAGGAAAFRVSERSLLQAALQDALTIVRAGRSAVVEVMLAPASSQVLGVRDQLA